MSSKKPKVARLQMRPTTVDTGFADGSYNPSTGQVSYTLDPQLAQLRDIFYGATEEFLPTEQQEQFAAEVGDYGRGLFSSATGMSIPQMTQEYYQKQQDILRRDRDIESSRLADQQYGTGRLGFGVGTDGGYINPQQYALQMARENQNAQLLLGAEDRARTIQSTDMQRALGLLDAENTLRMQPYSQTQGLFNMGAGIEGLGMGVLDTVGQFGQLQQSWQQMQQQNDQARNNARASGGFMGGLGGALLNAGLGYATGGFGSALGASLGSSIGNWTGGLFSSTPATSWSSLPVFGQAPTSAFGTSIL